MTMIRAVKTSTLYMPRWHAWRRLSISASIDPAPAQLASEYSSDHKWRGWRDRENQLIYEQAIECHAGRCTVAEFHTFARMVIEHQHPDIVACHEAGKMKRPELERMTSATMARRKMEHATAVIDHVTLDDLGLDDDDV